MTTYLTVEDLLILCDQLGRLQVRDVGLLDSAAHRPASVLFGVEAYPDLHSKAAVLLESIVRNHPLVDGNKRLGWVAAVVFYGLNGIELDAPEDPAYDLVIAVADGRTNYRYVAETLAEWTEPAQP
ncbi:type II toxin-antitoxin system death-on-curing family toxin [Georgenia sp. TF02-10]|uniref:type II toxin-antitoxin system death-on-curing family toxin n=1 Tax=Georgenia sp. TF02-10 TaxID=2917725 RepID=UPI001FA6C18A|nr:type II toxin-antitoxin system death-on-curing family toxin [Georgenia sp. TF02-10]UNX53935.1 type II toxin-antitoxin system death-on-curing family toxin [Georgenia sp. TF02-10]